jgi:hypothetical protein
VLSSRDLFAELGKGERKLLIVGGELLLLLRIEIGAAADVAVVEPSDETLLLRIQPEVWRAS